MSEQVLVVFDCDGTLVDSQLMIVAAMEEAFAAHGMACPERARVLSIVGLSLHEAVAALVPEAPDDLVATLAASYKSAFGRLRTRAELAEPLFAGAADLIGRYAARHDLVLGIATGKSRRGVAALLTKHGFEGCFATVQTADDAPSKPHPAMLLQALDETGVAPERAVMVGDTTFDMEMARRAGLRPVGVDWGYHGTPALEMAGAERIISGFEQLDAVVDAIAGGRADVDA